MDVATIDLDTIWNTLLSGTNRYYTRLGFFMLGDAYLISGKNPVYKDEIVLVEHRERRQYNHWGFRCPRQDCRYAHVVCESNGDDGNGKLNKKARRLKVLE